MGFMFGITGVIKPFLPSDLPGLVRWFRGSSLVGADGDPISTWVDESASAQDVTSSGISRPTISDTGINGRRCASFSGINLISGSDTFLPTGDKTSFSVLFSSSPSTQIVSAYGLASGGSMVTELYLNSGADAFIVVSQFGDSIGPTTPPFDSVDPRVVSITNSGTIWNIWRNGSDMGSKSMETNTSLGSSFSMGGGNAASPGLPFTGFIGERLIYDSLLSDPDRIKVENYLKSGFGI